MPALAASSDAFHAIAGAHRRAILELVSERECPVNEVVARLDISQPSASKHLRVLREANLVRVRRDGRQRLYSADLDALRPVADWVAGFERFWNHQLDSIERRLAGETDREGAARSNPTQGDR